MDDLVKDESVKADLCRKNLFLANYIKMARSYSRKKGKSGSTRPISDKAPEWANKDVKSIKELIVEMAKSGKTSSQIGMILRDSHAVPDVRAMAGSTVGVIIKEAGLKREIPDDLLALIKRDIDLAKHLETNKKDMTAKRGQQLTLSKINRLVSYYKSTEILPQEWAYDRAKAVQWII